MNGSFSKFMTMALVCSVSLAAALPVQAYQSPLHIFKIQDVMGDFEGYTYGNPNPLAPDGHSIICGNPGGKACPSDAPLAIEDKEGNWLYPIDSEFGFHVVDFLGATPKGYDGDHMEGWVGSIMDGDTAVGIKVSNAETARYKVKPPMGTWCQGLGNTSIKCSTEHYSAMEHVLSCHEVIPYRFADPFDGTQSVLKFDPLDRPEDGFDCQEAELDDLTYILAGGNPSGDQLEMINGMFNMDPNDNTTVMDDIAVGSDYSVTLKDDGKALYRWGGMIKRPNDIRLYAQLELPDQWKEKIDDTDEFANDFVVTKAVLKVEHWITNNPNDQLRPEDLENEAATGRKPDYRVDAAGNWLTTRDCFESDAHYIDSEEDSPLDIDYGDPVFIPEDTYLKNVGFADDSLFGETPPPIFSKDLKYGFSNAYYTTTNRDPFEWSYRKLGDSNLHQFRGSLVPLDPTNPEGDQYLIDGEFYEFITGPRWRLRANKFGQDICGLEIPLKECSPPPFKKDNIKYVVGEKVTTIINLLDWADCENPDDGVNGNCSPLATSKGWVKPNEHVEILSYQEDGTPVTSNGLPMTEDFDLAVYIKGDRKPVALFNASLEIEYVGDDGVVPDEWNVMIKDLVYPETVYIQPADPPWAFFTLEATIVNDGPAWTAVDVQLVCTDHRGVEWTTTEPPVIEDGLDDDEKVYFMGLAFNLDSDKPATLTCQIDAIAEGDVYPTDNTVEFKVKVKKPKE